MLIKYYLFVAFISRYYFIIKYYASFCRILKNKSYDDIKHFKIHDWHHGFAYFTATLNGLKVFIKFDTQLNIISNDYNAYEILKNNIPENLVKIVDYDLSKNIQYVAYEFELGSKELKSEDLIEEIELVNQIKLMVDIINKEGIIHRDIKLDNFLLCNGKIKIIDFTFSVFPGAKDLDLNYKKNCNILRGLGKGLNPKPFFWDDVYAVYNILLKINDPKFVDCIDELKKNIGKNTYSVECRSLSFKIISYIKELIKNNLLFK